MKKTVIDLFCGCGGLSYGFEQAGYKILLGIDNDRASIESFSKNHKGTKTILKDILEVSNSEVLEAVGNTKVDVIIGGPPCQGLSLSGPRKYTDPRNKLFLSFVRIAEFIKPKAVVLENVPGLTKLYNGRVKDEIIEEFTKLGYDMYVRELIAADFGVPQMRKRVVFIGLKEGNRKFIYPEPTYHPPGSMLKPVYITTEEALGDLPLLDGLGEAIQNYTSEPENGYQKLMRKKSKSIQNHIGTEHTEEVKKIISLVPEGGNYKNLPDEYRNTRNFHVAWTRFHSKRPAPTIDTGHRHHFHYKYNRVPTVRESARLQSFPDRFVFYGSKTEQYRQVGNAVSVLLAKAIADRLESYL